ncbi:adenylate/guanylate cyclase domain-containing protein [Mycolicibacterium sarraceniae]|uniref:Guanylate cyclase domain-containing protein n=1 Tax=Mycolicibacterium sarraceniae TaxID=1534348 RepID=A0A7I7SX14_9MYCO|nr:adenylate/guanylate cyclase domain-containing protein [Mycolicibacterium sarraceniae]BBY61328.1 hypothetical protein MSAR_44640 [Mycolicibacterium sarraceniae]
MALAAEQRNVNRGGEECRAAVLFVDIVGSTQVVGSRPPVQVVELAAARAMAAQLRRDVPGIGVSIGVAAGIMVAGNFGSHHRFEYTVIGDPVQEASRLCGRSTPSRLAVAATASTQPE